MGIVWESRLEELKNPQSVREAVEAMLNAVSPPPRASETGMKSAGGVFVAAADRKTASFRFPFLDLKFKNGSYVHTASRWQDSLPCRLFDVASKRQGQARAFGSDENLHLRESGGGVG